MNDVYELGDVVMLTRGEYSDFEIEFLAITKKPFTRKSVIYEWAKDTGRTIHPARNAGAYGEMGRECVEANWAARIEERIDLFPWMVQNGYVEEMEWKKFHRSNYSDIYI